MVTVTDRYLVKLHPFAAELPADLVFLALEGRAALLPADQRIYPAIVALAWHRKNVFDNAG
jgi:hypothetical protein